MRGEIENLRKGDLFCFVLLWGGENTDEGSSAGIKEQEVNMERI